MSKLLKKKKKNGGKFEKVKDIAIKMNQQEKMKAEQRKKAKKEKPMGYRSRKAGVVVFWLAFAFMLLFVMVNVGKKDNVTSVSNEPTFQKSMSAEAVEFSKGFLSDYFTWTDDGSDQEKRKGKMAYYATAALAEKMGTVKDGTWDSTLRRDSIILKKSQNLGDNRALLTFQTNITFTKTEAALQKEMQEKAPTNPPAENGAANQGQAPNVEDFGAGTLDVVLNEQGIVKKITKKKFVSVYLYYDNSTDRFVIYQEPAFTYVEETPNSVSFEPETRKLQSIIGPEADEIKQFLITFFESYANDPKEKLSYFIEDKTYQVGLNQSMEFVEVKDVTVYEGKTDEEKVVEATVIFAEPDTSIPFSSYYTIVIGQKEDRFVVKHINNKRYIDELLKRKDESEKDVTSFDNSPVEEGSVTEK